MFNISQLAAEFISKSCFRVHTRDSFAHEKIDCIRMAGAIHNSRRELLFFLDKNKKKNKVFQNLVVRFSSSPVRFCPH
jgi:hypothetical protein